MSSKRHHERRGNGQAIPSSIQESVPMLTIFTAPKPFHGLIDVIQRNALGSWLNIGSEVEVLLIGDEEGLAEAAQAYNVRFFPEVERNDLGTPLVSSIFQLARENAHNPLLCFVNADVMLMDDVLDGVTKISDRFDRFLVIGQRWDLDVDRLLDFNSGWVEEMRMEVQRDGRLHPPAGSDYFIFPSSLFKEIPPLAIGRAGWDNWMIYAARANGIPVIDATGAITVIHQNHDYGHLPGGQPHYNLPESDWNVRLAGGAETIFTLNDADWRLDSGRLSKRTLQDIGIVRVIEASIILNFGPGRAARILLSILHPLETIRYYFGAVKRRLSATRHGSEKG